jgi:hypothetical protein
MRTTLTLDPDVAAAVKRLRRVRNESLRKLINEALRRGLRRMSAGAKRRQRFRTKSVNLGRVLIPRIDNIAEALETAEIHALEQR